MVLRMALHTGSQLHWFSILLLVVDILVVAILVFFLVWKLVRLLQSRDQDTQLQPALQVQQQHVEETEDTLPDFTEIMNELALEDMEKETLIEVAKRSIRETPAKRLENTKKEKDLPKLEDPLSLKDEKEAITERIRKRVDERRNELSVKEEKEPEKDPKHMGGLETVEMNGEKLLIKRMKQDGDSLYSAFVYRRYGYDIDSKEHINKVGYMRRKIARHLDKEYLLFKDELMNDISRHHVRYKLLEPDDKLRAYLADLAKPGFPTSLSATWAISDIQQVIIMLYAEDVAPVTINSNFGVNTKTIKLLQSQVTNEYGEIVDHYDCIVQVIPIEGTQ